jgi:hypothetical protein
MRPLVAILGAVACSSSRGAEPPRARDGAEKPVPALKKNTAVADVDAFLVRWPRAAQSAQSLGYLDVLRADAKPCHRHPDPPPPSGFSISPDGTQLLAVVPVDLEPALAQRLGLEPKEYPMMNGTVVIGLDGGAGIAWLYVWSERDGCTSPTPSFRWRSDGKRAAVVWKHQYTDVVGLFDLDAHAMTYRGSGHHFVFAPNLRRVAFLDSGSGRQDRSAIAGDGVIFGDKYSMRVWGDADWDTGYRASDLRWISDAAFTFCGTSLRENTTALYRVEIETPADPSWVPPTKVIAIGVCSQGEVKP